MNSSLQKLIQIKILPGAEAAGLVDPFYLSQNSKHQARTTDIFFVAFLENQVVGTVRFCVEEKTPLLRSMMIHQEHRKKGIGKKILGEFQKYLDHNKIKDTYCLPYSHLEIFYKKIGFTKIQENKAPSFLQERLSEYRRLPKEFICVKRT